MVESINIKLFSNLANLEYDGIFYDFHNDYECLRLFFEEEKLILFFQSNDKKKRLEYTFVSVKITRCDLKLDCVEGGLTVDNIYRGRVELGETLHELDLNGRGYFYLEMYNGWKMEFWAKGINIISCRVS